jgi:hypothetical protein
VFPEAQTKTRAQASQPAYDQWECFMSISAGLIRQIGRDSEP